MTQKDWHELDEACRALETIDRRLQYLAKRVLRLKDKQLGVLKVLHQLSARHAFMDQKEIQGTQSKPSPRPEV